MANVGIPDSSSSGGGRPGNGSALAGVALLLAGAALLYMGVASVAATEARSVPSALPAAPCPPPVSCASGAATSAMTTTTAAPVASARASAATSASGAPSASAAPAASASASPPPGTGDAPLLVIHFVKKEVIPQKEDIAKLAGLGNKLARRENVKLVLEGFGDDAGADEATKGLGRRRGTVLRRTLGDLGIGGDRVTITPVDVSESADGAGTVRLRTIPPMSEGDLK